MFHHWLLIFSWLGTARLQYINTGGPGADTILDPLDSAAQYVQYLNVPSRNDYEHDEAITEYYPTVSTGIQTDQLRNRRKAEETDERAIDFADKDKTLYFRNEELAASPFVVGFRSSLDENSTDLLEPMEKRYFSPWGGKRSKVPSSAEHMWTWKRGSNAREPSMPKRVRFSPWGGKRSGQMIYKPGESKGSKIIFSTTIPELTRIVSNYLPSGQYNVAGYQLIHTLDKRHPFKVLALSTRMDEKTLREAMPFKTFLETLPKMFKPGHPYLDVNLKKDGKRKVKFSAWGGKRSPPIIGPIWTPAAGEDKDSALDTILLIRNNQEKKEPTLKAV